MPKVERIDTLNKFIKLLRHLKPSELYYAQAKAPLSRPPTGLRLTFSKDRVQYVFIDTAKVNVLRRTKIPLHVDKYGNINIEEEDIIKFIHKEAGNKNIKISSFELMGGY